MRIAYAVVLPDLERLKAPVFPPLPASLGDIRVDPWTLPVINWRSPRVQASEVWIRPAPRAIPDQSAEPVQHGDDTFQLPAKQPAASGIRSGPQQSAAAWV